MAYAAVLESFLSTGDPFMQITIKIDPTFPRWLRRLALHAGVPILLATAGAVYAQVGDLHQFEDGEVLSAETLNENFSALAEAIEAQATELAAATSAAAPFEPCGLTAETTGAIAAPASAYEGTAGAITTSASGYEGAASLCRLLATCDEGRARMCAAAEMVQFASNGGDLAAQLGADFPTENNDCGWIASGTLSESDQHYTSDCNGFKDGSIENFGSTWDLTHDPGRESCAAPHRILCCD